MLFAVVELLELLGVVVWFTPGGYMALQGVGGI
jgi:hypothetical protein